ncbi:YhbD family protein [Paenibacillus sp. CC-CFT747]|nr:YhbD family protein [Paenibacillus sp. CC-CFT747]
MSYGQLYRWKRQNLIPESWFIKQSSFTGQETFFHRDKILTRVRGILELKDSHSLEELAELLSPELTNKSFALSRLQEKGLWDPDLLVRLARRLNKLELTFMEAVLAYVAGRLREEHELADGRLEELLEGMEGWIPQLGDTSYRLYYCVRDGTGMAAVVPKDSPFLTDAKVKQVYDLEEIARLLKAELEEE